MAYKGKRITNPHNGQTITFLTTSRDSAGQLLEMTSTWEPRAVKPAEHYHPFQSERFEVLEGQLSVVLDGKKMLLKAGDTLDIPANGVHSMWNESNKPVTVSWKVFPALNTEYLLETGTGLANAGKTKKNGLPDILQASLIARRYSREFRLSRPSHMIQRIVFALLSPIALVSGRKSYYKEFVD